MYTCIYSVTVLFELPHYVPDFLLWGFNTFLTGIIKSLFTAICLDRGTQQHVEEEWAYIFFVNFLDDCFDAES